MAEFPTFVPVVAALVRDTEGRVLLQQALPGKPHAGEWEFPGGKVDAGETPRAAVVREIAEELGLTLLEGALTPVGFADQPARNERPALVLFLYSCPEWRGEPAGLDGQRWGWFTREEARELPLAPLDRALLAALAAGPLA